MTAMRRARPAAELALIACSDGLLLERAENIGVRTSVVPLPKAVANIGDSHLQNSGSLRQKWRLVREVLSGAPRAWQHSKRIRLRVAGIGPDLVHSNGIKTHFLAHWAGLKRVPILWHIHDFYGSRPMVGRLLRLAHRRVAGAIAVSEAVASDAAATLPGLPVQVLYNALDTTEFAPEFGEGEQLDRLAGLPPATPGTVRVGLVATYARWKGQPVFLQAAARLLHARPTPAVRFYLIGGPIYETQGSQFSEVELRNLAAELNVQGHVGFIGFQESPADMFRRLDIVVHASTKPEPFGMTIVEAMACARPVVACRAGGAMELFRDGHDAVGVQPGDVGALAAALQALIDNPERRRQLGEDARRSVLRRFDSSRLGTEILEIYDRILCLRQNRRLSPSARYLNHEDSHVLHGASI
jgi:glycosyltransferase involved in cell wall biosynthesis